MAKIKVDITNDMIKVVKNIKFKNLKNIYDTLIDNKEYRRESPYYGINAYELLYGSYDLHLELCYILGLTDKIIKGSEEDWDGVSIEKETYDYLETLIDNIFPNIEYIMQILIQNADTGISEGTYVAKDYELIWKKIK